MASRKAHERDCIRNLGNKCTAVHAYMDKHFRTYGVHHRFKSHHVEGIEECAKYVSENSDLSYKLAKKAAVLHMQLDFGNLAFPHRYDYARGDGSWPTSEIWNDKCPFDVDLCDMSGQIPVPDYEIFIDDDGYEGKKFG